MKHFGFQRSTKLSDSLQRGGRSILYKNALTQNFKQRHTSSKQNHESSWLCQEQQSSKITLLLWKWGSSLPSFRRHSNKHEQLNWKVAVTKSLLMSFSSALPVVGLQCLMPSWFLVCFSAWGFGPPSYTLSSASGSSGCNVPVTDRWRPLLLQRLGVFGWSSSPFSIIIRQRAAPPASPPFLSHCLCSQDIKRRIFLFAYNIYVLYVSGWMV